MYSSKYDQRITWSQSLFCGGMAGVVSRTVTSPLEVVKVLVQVGSEQTQHGLAKTFLNVYKNEGIRAFWKGNWITCLRLFPYSSLQFLAFNSFMMSFERLSDEHLSFFSAAISGLGSTAIASFAVYPLDVIRTRLILQTLQPQKHRILWTFKSVLKNEGFLALYRGLLPSIYGVVPFAGGSFLAYHCLDKMEYPSILIQNTELQLVISACIAGAFAQTMSYPFDTVRKKMQASRNYLQTGIKGKQVKYNGMSDVFNQTIELNGITGLWKGLTVNLFKIVAGTFVMYLIYEQSRRTFLYQNGYTVSPWDLTPKDDVDQSLLPHEVNCKIQTSHFT